MTQDNRSASATKSGSDLGNAPQHSTTTAAPASHLGERAQSTPQPSVTRAQPARAYEPPTPSRRPGEKDASFNDRMAAHNDRITAAREAGPAEFNGLSGLRAADLTASDRVFLRYAEEDARARFEAKGKEAPDNLRHELLVGDASEMSVGGDGDEVASAQFEKDRDAWVRAYASQNPQLYRSYNQWIGEKLAS